jgi:hypothetical protein
MNIMYFEDIEMGKRPTNQQHTRLGRKRSSNSPAIGTRGLFILTIKRQYRQFLEGSLPVRHISFPFFRGLPHMVKGAPHRWQHWVLMNFVCTILFDLTTRSLARLHTLKSTSPGPSKIEELFELWHHYPISKI